jgi:catechol 2,3-dioxygenase-like lactoylglutathione lyase family enzyme
MMSATAIDQAYAKLPARDVERARAFYADKLGLTPFGEYNNHLYYELEGSHFMVYPSGGAASGTHDQLGFVVDDVGSTVAALRSAAWSSRSTSRQERPRPRGSRTSGASGPPGSRTARAT